MARLSSFKKNIISSALLQCVTVASGLFLPRLILGAFGSEVNGLISSITKFLSYVSLMEAGVGSVAKAALFKPLADGNVNEVSRVMNSCNNFFRKIATFFLIYLLALAVGYPFLSKNGSFSYSYIFSLTLILGITGLAQYFFGLSSQLLLQADQKIYIINILQIVSVAGNALVCALLIYLNMNVHSVKLISALILLVRPVGMYIYIRRKYTFVAVDKKEKNILSQRWDGFAHHIAYFIHQNADVVVLTFFSTYSEISVYAMYNMVISNVQSIIWLLSASIISKLGSLIAKANLQSVQKTFRQYETFTFNFATLLFCITGILIVPFIQIYTNNVSDVNYSRTVFATIIICAEYLHVLRTPYNNLVMAAGHFKNTRNGAIIEALINVLLSLALVNKLGLVGVAIGTLIAMLFRVIDLVIYTGRHILQIPPKQFIGNMLMSLIAFAIGYLLCNKLIIPLFTLNDFVSWCFCAVLTAIVCAVVVFGIQMLLNRKNFIESFVFLAKG